MRIDCIEVCIGRDNVDVIRLQQRALIYLLYGKANVLLQQLREMTLMIRQKMNHHYVSQAAIGGDIIEKCSEGRQPAGGSPEADDGRFGLGWGRFQRNLLD